AASATAERAAHAPSAATRAGGKLVVGAVIPVVSHIIAPSVLDMLTICRYRSQRKRKLSTSRHIGGSRSARTSDHSTRTELLVRIVVVVRRGTRACTDAGLTVLRLRIDVGLHAGLV